ncbi:hypothetical protein AB0M39_19485 [Streptomyces sp. NPDC051907]|uniref:hypothetical protein n=1 Tax=Streptomyces sp. NPDC051907 TaxID=3155284 RepID=UPI003437B87E
MAEAGTNTAPATLSGPYGPLSPPGPSPCLRREVPPGSPTDPEGRIPAVPGRGTDGGDEPLLSAGAADGLTVDGKPLVGHVRLAADHGRISDARAAHGRATARRHEDVEATAYDPAERRPGASGRTRTGAS